MHRNCCVHNSIYTPILQFFLNFEIMFLEWQGRFSDVFFPKLSQKWAYKLERDKLKKHFL
jgi:hypothetical protein